MFSLLLKFYDVLHLLALVCNRELHIHCWWMLVWRLGQSISLDGFFRISLWKSHIKRPKTLIGPSPGAAIVIDLQSIFLKLFGCILKNSEDSLFFQVTSKIISFCIA